jgi:hypothetical protein
MALVSVGGSPNPPAPDLPSGWKGPALGQAPVISTDASGSADYTSPYSARTVEGQEEEPADEELLRVRGESKRDEEVHGIISWTTRKDYPLLVGVSPPIKDQVGDEFHEGQLWEATDEQWIITKDDAEYVYTWLMNRLSIRSTVRGIPDQMPQLIDEVTVQVRKDGKAGYILFTPVYSLAVPMRKMDVQAVIEYDQGYMKVGMGEAYTVSMLAYEFWELTQRTWEIYPIEGYRCWTDGSVVHKTTPDIKAFHAVEFLHSMLVLPAKILEERRRGTEIHSTTDQDKLLQYWAWLQQPIEVGVYFPETNYKIEYWMTITLQPVPGDDAPMTYHRILKELWMERTREISQGVEQCLASLGDDFGVGVKYLCDRLRVWFVPNASRLDGITRPLAEESCPKDKWYSWTDIMAFTIPTLPDAQVREEPAILFGPGS